MRLKHFASLGFAALLSGASPATVPIASAGTSAASSSGIGFQVPTVVDPIHTNGEPDIAIDIQGRVFVSGPTGTGTQRSTWFGSVDGGQTFRVMAQKTPPDPIIGIPAPGPGGGDTDINFDRSGKQYFTDLYALACLRVAVTGPTNSGAADQEDIYPGGCAAIPGADRQWLAVYDPPATPTQSAYTGPTPLIYLEFNNVVGPGPNGGAQWNKSTDGLTFVNATADETPSTGPGVGYSPFGPDGYPAIDQVTGKVFQAAGCTTANGCTSNGIFLNIGTPDASGTLHFLDTSDRRNARPEEAHQDRRHADRLAGHAFFRAFDGQRAQPRRGLVHQQQHAKPAAGFRQRGERGHRLDEVDQAGAG